jgi:hypothetical protein
MTTGDDQEVWVVWSQDSFGFGEDRDPPLVEAVHATREAAEADLERLRRREANNTFLRFWLRRMPRAELPPRGQRLRR